MIIELSRKLTNCYARDVTRKFQCDKCPSIPLPGSGEFKDFVNENTTELKTNANTITIKENIIGPMNALMEGVNNTSIVQKTLIGHTLNLITELESKMEQKEQCLEDIVDSKIEEALDDLFYSDGNSESEVQDAVKALL